MGSKMKINFLAPHLRVSGGMRIILTYASLLAAREHDVTVYVRSSNLLRRTIANILGLGKPNWIKNFKAQVIRVPDFTKENIRPADAIVATTMQTAEILNDYPDEKGKKFFFIQHKEGLYHGSEELEKRTFGYPMHKIVVSSWLNEIINKEYGSDADLLLNPVDLSQYHPVKRTAPADEIRILMLHHTYEWKGTSEGAEIVNELKKKYGNVKVEKTDELTFACAPFVVGLPEGKNIKLIMFGARKETIEQEYGCDEYYFNPPQESLSEIYSDCDIFLCPSWDEGYGLPSVEAMACRCAVVTYDNGGSRDYAFDGKTALVAPRRNKEDLKSKLEQLILDKGLRERISDAGYRQVLSMPTWDEQVLKLEEILKI
jgi:glycosyltransferase involved in cell wall biosynthesis